MMMMMMMMLQTVRRIPRFLLTDFWPGTKIHLLFTFLVSMDTAGKVKYQGPCCPKASGLAPDIAGREARYNMANKMLDCH